MNTIEELINEHFTNSVNVNKGLIEQLGKDAALLLGELISKQKYWNDRGETDNGFFFWSMKDIRQATGLGRRSQERVIPKLEKNHIIAVKREVRHPLWFKVNIDVVMDKLAYVQKGHRAMSKKDTGLCPKWTTTNPLTNPTTKVTTEKGSKEVEPNLKDIVSLYYQLIEKATGEKPIYQWARDCSVLKKAADGQVMAQGEDKVRVKLEAWFANDNNGFLRSKGYPLALFAAQYNNIVTGSNRVNDLPNYTGASDRMLYGGKDVYL